MVYVQMRIRSVVGYLFPGIRGPTGIPGFPGCDRLVCRTPSRCGGALYPCLWDWRRKERLPIICCPGNGSIHLNRK